MLRNHSNEETLFCILIICIDNIVKTSGFTCIKGDKCYRCLCILFTDRVIALWRSTYNTEEYWNLHFFPKELYIVTCEFCS